jgi:repressor LexA
MCQKIGEKIKFLCGDMPYTKVASDLEIDPGNFSKILKGKRGMPTSLLKKICDYFEVSADYMLRDDNLENINSYNNVFVLGNINAGLPNYITEDITEYITLPKNALSTQDTFCIHVKGDSMINAGIKNGDYVFIKKQDYIDKNGDIMAVLVNNEEGTLKRVYRTDSSLILQPENPNYHPIIISNENLNNIKIIGKVVGLFTKNIL